MSNTKTLKTSKRFSELGLDTRVHWEQNSESWIVVVKKILDCCFKMTSLENRSSLRKLEFPSCTMEALKRLHNTCKTVTHKLPSLDPNEYKTAPNPAAFLILSPKETELVLDVIDEFVFFTKSSLSKSRRLTTVQELQLLQIITEFYQENLEEAPESLQLNERTGPLLLLTNYLFLDKRSTFMNKFTILALSLKHKSSLHCIGLWLQQHQGYPAALQLTENVCDSYISLVTDSLECLDNIPNISPVFSSNLVLCLTELHNKIGQYYGTNSLR